MIDGQTEGIAKEVRKVFGEDRIAIQATSDGIPTLWAEGATVREVLSYLHHEVSDPYRTLYDLTAIDERERIHREGQPESAFTVVYHLLSYGRKEDVRVKIPVGEELPRPSSVVDIWPSANWYEREVWDLFGISFDGHPDLRRILMPPAWKGHPLRKEHPARATELAPFQMTDAQAAEAERLMFHPERDWSGEIGGDKEMMVLNLGPHHPGTHGVLRVILELDGEEITRMALDIGYHHRGAEKMGERQSWHTYIPFTDRIDYLSGSMNNFPYVLAVEQLAGIEVPEKAMVVRVMIAELFRIASHLVFYGTFAQDLGAMSPVFFTFNDRERLFRIIEAICGGRMHPEWFRIGGVADDLPDEWEKPVREFIAYMPARLREYEKLVMKNSIFKKRTKGVGILSLQDAIDWGVTGPNLRACGLAWDLRKTRPYSGYDRFDFEVPVATEGDCYSRARVRVEEIRQSLRIIEQCVDNMPSGPYKSEHPLTTPPRKERTMHDIETLIAHFLNVSWGPVVPPGEAACTIEASKGNTGYYLISDGNTMSYRTRIRTPSFAHLQVVPMVSKGLMIADLIAILGSIDYVLGDVDR
ncbi:MAG TPA: NADH-quinone oxidoreductase subunit C/D [Syntrophorhabdaceae bacterium]|jgi:NADH-quinone oxidoreductase subunit C/D